jgi:hypothetical protein
MYYAISATVVFPYDKTYDAFSTQVRLNGQRDVDLRNILGERRSQI